MACGVFLGWPTRQVGRQLAVGCTLFLGACLAVTDEQIRGTDRQEFLPSGRVRLEGETKKPEFLEGGEFVSSFEGGYQQNDGEFDVSVGEAKCRSSIGYAAWAPSFEYNSVRLEGFLGLSFGEIEVVSPGNDSRQNDVGAYTGFGLRYRQLGIVEPYARLSRGESFEWSISRFEIGFEFRPMSKVGVECAYALQTNRIEPENTDGGARIETDGLHIGLVLRF